MMQGKCFHLREWEEVNVFIKNDGSCIKVIRPSKREEIYKYLTTLGVKIEDDIIDLEGVSDEGVRTASTVLEIMNAIESTPILKSEPTDDPTLVKLCRVLNADMYGDYILFPIVAPNDPTRSVLEVRAERILEEYSKFLANKENKWADFSKLILGIWID